MSLTLEERRTFKILVQRMDQRFGSSKHKNRWLSKLEMRRRMPGENIADVGDDIRQLSQKAYSNLDIDAQESLALNHLYKIIPVEMKCRCIDKECSTVAEAVDVIERYESIMGDGDKKKINVRHVDQEQAVKQPTGEQKSNNLEDTIKSLINRLEKLESAQRMEPRKGNNSWTCFICNSPDHLMKDCPDRWTRGQQMTPTSNLNKRHGSGNMRDNKYH
ncbi:uncharacterized protein LOC134237324 [Saccostrea cucullata]|uniref:uncharacterized protein LOC134237324 n=1 Tax=Saccostrea cuccullata TaxID=36930 RepID=UPI002ED4BE4F